MDMIESIEMWLHEIEPKWVEKELAWLEELRTRLLEEKSEKPMNLEEEIKRTYHDGSVADTSDINHVTYENIASHFYEIGCRRTAEKFDEIEYNRQMAEERQMEKETPKDLEEAAKVYFENPNSSWQVKDVFIAGSEWRYQKDRAKFAKLKAKEWSDGYNEGIVRGKEQMLKEAEECELYWDGYFLTIDLNMTALGYSEGDKVRIIIVKEDEK